MAKPLRMEEVAELVPPAGWARRSGRQLARLPITPEITVLMCTFNGARFLRAQLASLEQQTHANWRLIVSDDGSTDQTLDIIAAFAARVSQRVEVRMGPGRGASANFMALAADNRLTGKYFAFCDQDDIWHPDKLRRALAWLHATPQSHPAVYSGRTRLVDENGNAFSFAPRFCKTPNFANALAQSIAGANTMLLNRAAKRLLEAAGAVTVVSHDWWAYQLVTGAGGHFHYDAEPCLDYRQHSDNCIGCNRGWRAQLKRCRMVIDGGFALWNDVNLAALRRCRHLLTADARATLVAYEAMRHGGLLVRLNRFARSGIRRQTLVGNLALVVALMLKRL